MAKRSHQDAFDKDNVDVTIRRQCTQDMCTQSTLDLMSVTRN